MIRFKTGVELPPDEFAFSFNFLFIITLNSFFFFFTFICPLYIYFSVYLLFYKRLYEIKGRLRILANGFFTFLFSRNIHLTISFLIDSSLLSLQYS